MCGAVEKNAEPYNTAGIVQASFSQVMKIWSDSSDSMYSF